ncbi:DUF1937 family protein [Paenirhodobacter populi]|uniref:DUF1937 family protein n=1 Tax=Paenirhodobacter populi TaxID=2306993 RepID=A0A443JE91_9RHOB|nr:DUF1937 family protein [Sinirhodobacter populi]RWR18814.1 DUF1937 family protein [Sinirhodobacter populi]
MLATVKDWTALMAPDGNFAPLIHVGADARTVARHNVGIAYLATPYTREVTIRGKWSFDRSVMLSAMASRHMLLLMRERVTAVSPIVLASEALHAQSSTTGRRLSPLDRDFWMDWCRPILNSAAMIVVPDIPGWDQSDGIWTEVQFAVAHNVPVFIYAGRG